MSGIDPASPNGDVTISRRASSRRTMPSVRRGSQVPGSPQPSKSDVPLDGATRSVRDLTVLRETYSAAREVYTGLMAKQPDPGARKRQRFFMAGYAVLIAVRTALQKKRYRLEITKQRALVHVEFLAELKQIGADAASIDAIDSGIAGVFEMLRVSSDEQIDERLETLVEDIMKKCDASFDQAYELSQSLRCSLDELMIMRTQMDNLPVEAALSRMESICGPLSPLGFTSRTPSKQTRKWSKEVREEFQRDLARQGTESQEHGSQEADKGGISVAQAETETAAQPRLTTKERRLKLEERRSNLERIRADRKASAWLQHAQEVVGRTEEVKSTGTADAQEEEAGTDQGNPPQQAGTIDLVSTPQTSRLLQRRMSNKSNKPAFGSAAAQDLNNVGWRKVAQEGLLLPPIPGSVKAGDLDKLQPDSAVSSSSEFSPGVLLEDLVGPLTKSDGTCSTKTTAEDVSDLPDPRCLQDDSNPAASIAAPRKSTRNGSPRLPGFRSARSSRSPNGGGSPGGSRSPMEPGSRRGSRRASPMMLQRPTSRNKMAIEVPEFTEGVTGGMPALNTRSIRRHSERLASNRGLKTADPDDEMIVPRRMSTDTVSLDQAAGEALRSSAATALEEAALQAEAARWLMRGRMRSKDAAAAANQLLRGSSKEASAAAANQTMQSLHVVAMALAADQPIRASSKEATAAAANQPQLSLQIMSLHQPVAPSEPRGGPPRPGRPAGHLHLVQTGGGDD